MRCLHGPPAFISRCAERAASERAKSSSALSSSFSSFAETVASAGGGSSSLPCGGFVPLATSRSVVPPEEGPSASAAVAPYGESGGGYDYDEVDFDMNSDDDSSEPDPAGDTAGSA